MVRVYFDAKGLEKCVEQAIQKPLETIGKDTVDSIKDSLVSRNGEPAPEGSPPSVQSGALKESINYEVRDNTVTIGAGEEYAKYHEFGPRPFIRPIYYRNLKLWLKQFKNLKLGETPEGAKMNTRRA